MTEKENLFLWLRSGKRIRRNFLGRMKIDEINIFLWERNLYLGWLEFYYSRLDRKLIKTTYFR